MLYPSMWASILMGSEAPGLPQGLHHQPRSPDVGSSYHVDEAQHLGDRFVPPSDRPLPEGSPGCRVGTGRVPSGPSA